jgi:acyl-CoA thioesterase I
MTIRIVALGDSLTAGYPFPQKNSWVNILATEQGWDIANQGANGETTGEMLERFMQDVVYVKPHIVIITGGANDVLQQVPIEVIVNNYRAMIDLAKQHQICPVIGLTMAIDEPRSDEEVVLLRTHLEEFARKMELSVIDFYGALTDRESGKTAREWDYDGVHPNPRGYQRMAEAAYPILACILNQISDKATEASLVNGFYRHYKGNMYQVLGVAKHSETLENMVVYRALYGNEGLWVRPLHMFTELVEVDGKKVKRFDFVIK